MDRAEAELIVTTQTVRCARCRGTGIYRWGVVVNGAPSHQGVCYGCGGAKRLPASKRRIMDAERALGLRPPVKSRPPKAVPASRPASDREPFDWDGDFTVPF